MNRTTTMAVTDGMVDAAHKAFSKAEPGVLRRVQLVDSYPGEHRDDPEAYQNIPTSLSDEKKAIRVAVEAALERWVEEQQINWRAHAERCKDLLEVKS